MTTHVMTIVPTNEPDGEGNGWVDCPAKDATSWQVWEGDDLIEAFDTWEAAFDFITT